MQILGLLAFLVLNLCCGSITFIQIGFGHSVMWCILGTCRVAVWACLCHVFGVLGCMLWAFWPVGGCMGHVRQVLWKGCMLWTHCLGMNYYVNFLGGIGM